MAFTSMQPLPGTLVNKKSPTANIGPGQYDVDSLAHKQLMAAIYPKKSAPFNSTNKREGIGGKNSARSPGKSTLFAPPITV